VAKSLNEWCDVLGREIKEDDVEPSTLALAVRGREVSAAAYLAVVADLQSWAREMAGWWANGFDLLVTPTLSEAPLVLGSRARDVFAIATFTTQFNITGQPAISLPLATGECGLPIGVQLVAGANREDQLLQVAADLEKAMPWTYPE
jgi:amidase